jgi:hypothetical protein
VGETVVEQKYPFVEHRTEVDLSYPAREGRIAEDLESVSEEY